MNERQIVLAVHGMHCASCGLLIDETLEDLPGVRASTTSVRAATTTVRADSGDSVTEAILVAEIAALGYTAQPIQR